MKVEDVTRIRLGTFVRPPEETETGSPRIEEVLGYLARTPAGILLLDTGLGDAGEETEAWYRPRRGARWELLDGEAELARGVHVIPTPGHVDGHQSVVLECDGGSIVLAGQTHDGASQWS